MGCVYPIRSSISKVAYIGSGFRLPGSFLLHVLKLWYTPTQKHPVCSSQRQSPKPDAPSQPAGPQKRQSMSPNNAENRALYSTNLSTTILRISSVSTPAFFGSFAIPCHTSPCFGSLSAHFTTTSSLFSCAKTSAFRMEISLDNPRLAPKTTHISPMLHQELIVPSPRVPQVAI